MKKYLLYVIVLAFTHCEKVINLSDKVSLEGFEIVDYSPKDIKLSTPTIRGDTVFISVLRGETLFPLEINGKPLYSEDTEQAVPGGSFSSFEKIVFEKENVDAKRFYLIARSGSPKAYYIQLEISNQSRENEILGLEIVQHTPDNILIAPEGFVNPIEKLVTIYSLPIQESLEVTANVYLSNNSLLKDRLSDKNDVLLKFDSIGAHNTVKIEAENGSISEWKVMLNKAKLVDESTSAEIISAVSLLADKQKITVLTPEFKVKEIGVNKTEGVIYLTITPPKEFKNLEIQPEFVFSKTSRLLGYKGEVLMFANLESTKEFYLIDLVSGYYKKWTIVLKVADLFDINKFPFTYKNAMGDYVRLADTVYIDNINSVLTFPVTRTTTIARYWPLTINFGEIELSSGAEMDVQELKFNNINDILDFNIVVGNKTKAWKAQLKFIGNISEKADIEDADIQASSYTELSKEDIVINSFTGDIFIDIPNTEVLPLRIQPHFTLSKGAEFSDFRNGEFIQFTNLTDKVNLEVIAENGTVKRWTIQLLNKIQLYNSDFELWVDKCPTNMSSLSIDPIPGIGRGWATANNTFIKGTLPVDHPSNGKAAELTTKVITFMPKNLITAGTLFLGRMDLSQLALETPKKMTKFGIPYTASPLAIALDAKYEPGETYQRSKKISGSGIGAKYELENLSGEDKGHIWVELIHWDSKEKFDYAGDPIEGVHVLARGEYVFEGKSDWRRLQINLERKAAYNKYKPTHFAVVMTSSIDGHLFVGALGSKLTVDNFELIY